MAGLELICVPLSSARGPCPSWRHSKASIMIRDGYGVGCKKKGGLGILFKKKVGDPSSSEAANGRITYRLNTIIFSTVLTNGSRKSGERNAIGAFGLPLSLPTQD